MDGKTILDAVEKVSPSAVFQNRNRPYDGQPHSVLGVRGMTEITGLTMRDITDCLRIAIWESCGSHENVESIYDCDISGFDAIAIEQNLICNIEKYMGIYPNIFGQTQTTLRDHVRVAVIAEVREWVNGFPQECDHSKPGWRGPFVLHRELFEKLDSMEKGDVK